MSETQESLQRLREAVDALEQAASSRGPRLWVVLMTLSLASAVAGVLFGWLTWWSR